MINFHDNWREGQEEKARWAAKLINNGESGLLVAPTGSGKTAIVSSAAHEAEASTVGLVKTKDLQVQYENPPYGWVRMEGKANYPCIDKPGRTVAECHYRARTGTMRTCPVYEKCEYVQAKDRAEKSKRAVLNYAYWRYMHKRWPTERLILDEAHELSDMIVEWAGIHIGEKMLNQYSFSVRPRVVRNMGKAGVVMVKNWVEKNIDQVKQLARSVEPGPERSRLELLSAEMDIFIGAVTKNDRDWFARMDRRQVICKPLTARHHFSYFFCKPFLMMTATPGNLEQFHKELGLKEISVRFMPHSVSPERRPVLDLKAPNMGYKTPKSGRVEQAKKIARLVNDAPRNWAGIVHVSSYRMANELMGLLREQTRRTIVTPIHGNKREQVAAWNMVMDQDPGALLVTPNLYTGYDGQRERINVIAKVAYPPVHDDEYAAARQAYDRKGYLQGVGRRFEQSIGRIWRKEEDYENSVVAIADGRWKHIRNYLSDSLLESIVEW